MLDFTCFLGLWPSSQSKSSLAKHHGARSTDIGQGGEAALSTGNTPRLGRTWAQSRGEQPTTVPASGPTTGGRFSILPAAPGIRGRRNEKRDGGGGGKKERTRPRRTSRRRGPRTPESHGWGFGAPSRRPPPAGPPAHTHARTHAPRSDFAAAPRVRAERTRPARARLALLRAWPSPGPPALLSLPFLPVTRLKRPFLDTLAAALAVTPTRRPATTSASRSAPHIFLPLFNSLPSLPWKSRRPEALLGPSPSRASPQPHSPGE